MNWKESNTQEYGPIYLHEEVGCIVEGEKILRMREGNMYNFYLLSLEALNSHSCMR